MQYRYVAPSALRAAPPMGSQDVLPLNLIALPARGGCQYGNPLIQNGGKPPPILDKPFSNIRRFSPLRMMKSAAPPYPMPL